KKLIITPIELGNSIEFRGKDDRVILRIPIRNLCAHKTGEVILKGRIRKVTLLQVKVQFWDQKQNEQDKSRDEQQNEQTILFNVQERYVDSIVDKINAKKINSKDLNDDVSYIIEDVKDLTNLEHAKKLIITPIELGNSIKFRG